MEEEGAGAGVRLERVWIKNRREGEPQVAWEKRTKQASRAMRVCGPCVVRCHSSGGRRVGRRGEEIGSDDGGLLAVWDDEEGVVDGEQMGAVEEEGRADGKREGRVAKHAITTSVTAACCRSLSV